MKAEIKNSILNIVLINFLFLGWLFLEEKSVFGSELFFAVALVFVLLFILFRKVKKSVIFLSLILEMTLLLIFKENQAAQNLSNIIFLFFILLILERTIIYLSGDYYED